jgi:iron(III) transport system substrate-binding protein
MMVEGRRTDNGRRKKWRNDMPNIISKTVMGLAGLLLLTTGANAQNAGPSDPKLADSWAFMQQQMPGVPASLLEDACKEGTLMVYYGTWIDAEEAQIKRFQERFPCIVVEKFTADTGQRRERWLAETRAGRHIADIIQDTDPGFLDDQAAKGGLTEYKISNDAAFDVAAKKDGFWYALRVALVGVAWNTDLVTDDEAAKLTTWEGITDPIWAGRAGVVDPSAGGVAYVPWYIWLKKFGPEFLEKIGALKPRIIAAITPASSALASGDIAVLLNASETGLLPLLDKGAPIRWSLPDPGIGPMTGQAIAASAPHLNAAKLFQEYSFAEEGYGIWQKLGGAPARKDFKDQRPVAQEDWYKVPASFIPYDPADAAKSVNEVSDAYHKYVGNAR